jgi:hypothetical protein
VAGEGRERGRTGKFRHPLWPGCEGTIDVGRGGTLAHWVAMRSACVGCNCTSALREVDDVLEAAERARM